MHLQYLNILDIISLFGVIAVSGFLFYKLNFNFKEVYQILLKS